MRKVRLSRRSFQTLATMAWKMAPMATASSTRVQTSQMRNSSVGYLGFGRTSHQILLPSGIEFVSTNTSIIWLSCGQDSQTGGMPVRGKALKTMLRYDLSPVSRPIQKGELQESASTWGRK